MSTTKRKRIAIFFSILIFIALLVFLILVFPKIAQKASEEKQQTLEDALYRASIQCYAIEGKYPPSVEYLEKYYGIVIDHKRFTVFYDGWAENVMPDITVISLDSLKGGAYETE
ncbi:MAG TPA: hypothetical protein DIT54_08740 [Lachnospiraceae bacterium]|jgi:hypothetical protein|nr:hypothetical protein [Lachnospiraceae bacterium]